MPYQLPDTPNLTDTKACTTTSSGIAQGSEVQALLRQHPHGVLGSKLPKYFRDAYGTELRYRQLGCEKLTDYMRRVE